MNVISVNLWFCIVLRGFAWLCTWFWMIWVIHLMCAFCNLVWSCRVILIWYTCLKILVSKLHLRRHFVQITFEIFYKNINMWRGVLSFVVVLHIFRSVTFWSYREITIGLQSIGIQVSFRYFEKNFLAEDLWI